MVSTSAFLACHQWGFESRLGLEISSSSMWHFLKLVVGGFLRILRFPPLLHRLMVSTNKDKAKINAIPTLSNLIAELSLHSYQVAICMLHVISTGCVACDLHMIAPGPLKRTCWIQFLAQWGDCKNNLKLCSSMWLLLFIIIITIIIITYVQHHPGRSWITLPLLLVPQSLTCTSGRQSFKAQTHQSMTSQ